MPFPNDTIDLSGSRFPVLSVIFMLGLLVGCEGPRDADARPIVVVSVPPQAFFVERLAGDAVRVEVMIPPGASPATYEPTIRQMRAVSKARLYIKVGHPNFAFEKAWLDQIIRDRPDLPVVDCSKNLKENLTGRQGDPHIWLSPPAVRRMILTIKGALAAILPGRRKELADRLGRFVEEIDRLDAEIKSKLAPHAGRSFFVFHPAWGAFAEVYGIHQVAIEHQHKEPSYAYLREMIKRIKDDGTHVVFIQPQFSRTSAELVANEVGAEMVTIDPLARDWLGNLREVTQALVESFEK